jgi:glycosyltransferase involved in cell wall biosynthesis
MKISVIIPSRLQPNPLSQFGNLHLDNALLSVAAQQEVDVDALEVVVGLDQGALERVPARFLGNPAPGQPVIRFVESTGEGQARAVNAAVRDSTGDVLAFLEDDDLWENERLRRGLEHLEQGFGFVSASQREVAEDEWRSFLRYNDFPTPSGWVMPRATWEQVGPLNEGFRWHVDTEWLGRAERAGVKRVHQVDPGGRDRLLAPGSWLANVRRHSAIAVMRALDPLVQRLRNGGGGMTMIASSPMARAQSIREHELMTEQFGGIPW